RRPRRGGGYSFSRRGTRSVTHRPDDLTPHAEGSQAELSRRTLENPLRAEQARRFARAAVAHSGQLLEHPPVWRVAVREQVGPFPVPRVEERTATAQAPHRPIREAKLHHARVLAAEGNGEDLGPPRGQAAPGGARADSHPRPTSAA